MFHYIRPRHHGTTNKCLARYASIILVGVLRTSEDFRTGPASPKRLAHSPAEESVLPFISVVGTKCLAAFTKYKIGALRQCSADGRRQPGWLSHNATLSDTANFGIRSHDARRVSPYSGPITRHYVYRRDVTIPFTFRHLLHASRLAPTRLFALRVPSACAPSESLRSKPCTAAATSRAPLAMEGDRNECRPRVLMALVCP